MAKKPVPEPVVEPAGPGKGHATRSRRDAQQARRRPLVPTDRRLAQRESRAQTAVDRERARIGYQRGEERYLPARDRGVQKRFARDWVDSRWSLGEVAVPVIVVLFLGSTIFASKAQLLFLVAMYAFMLITVVNGWLMARSMKRRIAERYGEQNVERGLNLYVILRSALVRRMRGPKPQLKRGDTPVLR